MGRPAPMRNRLQQPLQPISDHTTYIGGTMAEAILAKAHVHNIVIEDVLCEVSGDVEIDEQVLESFVRLLRPAVDDVVAVCLDGDRLHSEVTRQIKKLSVISPLAAAALGLFASNLAAGL